DRSHSPPHASGSRPGSPETLLSAQRNPIDFSGYRPDAIFQNWLILNSRRSGGLKLLSIDDSCVEAVERRDRPERQPRAHQKCCEYRVWSDEPESSRQHAKELRCDFHKQKRE